LSTDDRNALIVDENGGRIVKTNVYKAINNEQITKANCTVSETGNIDVSVERISKGTQYAFKSFLSTETDLEKKNYYLSEYRYINNLDVQILKLDNDKQNIIFGENLTMNAPKYAQTTGDRVLLPINITNRNSNVPPKIRNRMAPFEISRGYYDEDEIKIKFPVGYSIEAKAENVEIQTKFGTYKTTYQLTTDGIIYKRSYLLNNGSYAKEDYEPYRVFMEQIAQNDQAKIVLKKN